MHCFTTDGDDLLKSFDDATSWCRSQGYFLVRIKDPEVQAIVEQFVTEFELTSDDVWIGANRPTQEQWTWVNGHVYDGDNCFSSHCDLATSMWSGAATVNGGE